MMSSNRWFERIGGLLRSDVPLCTKRKRPAFRYFWDCSPVCVPPRPISCFLIFSGSSIPVRRGWGPGTLGREDDREDPRWHLQQRRDTLVVGGHRMSLEIRSSQDRGAEELAARTDAGAGEGNNLGLDDGEDRLDELCRRWPGAGQARHIVTVESGSRGDGGWLPALTKALRNSR